jgi:hypothetical protein
MFLFSRLRRSILAFQKDETRIEERLSLMRSHQGENAIR